MNITSLYTFQRQGSSFQPASSSNSVFAYRKPVTFGSSDSMSRSFFNGSNQQPTQFQRVKQTVQQLGQFSSFTKAQFANDRQNGVGVLAGAKNFSMTVSDLLNGLEKQANSYQNAQYKKIVATQGASPLDQLGMAAQGYLMGRVKKEALSTIMTEFGIDPAKTKLTDIAQMAYDSLFGKGTTAATTAAAGSAAAGTPGAATAATTTATAADSGLGAAAGNIVGAAGAAYSIYDLVSNFGKTSPVTGAIDGMTAGAYIGSIIPGVGTLIGGAVGGIIGAISGLFHSTGKSKEQLARDQVRTNLIDTGIIDKNYMLQLADGSQFDLGKDGHASYVGMDGLSHLMHEPDFSNPLSGQAVGLMNPLAMILTGGDKQLGTASAFAGYFANAVMSNAPDLETVRQNALAIYDKLQVTPDDIVNALGTLAQQGKIGADEYAAYVNGVRTLVEGFQPSDLVPANQIQTTADQTAVANMA